MFLLFNQEIDWLWQNLKELENLNNQIIICPSALSLAHFSDTLKNNKNIKVGAQNCSQFMPGAFTGEISVKSLKELNINCVIVGHSERRQYFGETNQIVMQKVKILIENDIVPIICIGESLQDYNLKKSFEIISQQLKPLLDYNFKDKEIIIAYEPVWAIGTGQIPDKLFLDDICNYIKSLINNYKIKYRIIYGGSVNSNTVAQIKQSKDISGFLIGKAGTDFQELKKIVS